MSQEQAVGEYAVAAVALVDWFGPFGPAACECATGHASTAATLQR